MRERNLPHLAARLFDTPLLAHPSKAKQVADAFIQQVGRYAEFQDIGIQAQVTPSQVPMRDGQRTYDVIEQVAIITVEGSLVHRLGTIGMYSGQTGYDGIAAQLRQARNDPGVRAIWMDFDTGGGEVAGAFDLAAEIRLGSLRNGGKPVWSMANEQAYSAGYLLASQADVMLAPRTAGVGSIGVIMMHADYSQALGKAGVDVTVIRAGEHKAKGNPYEKLDDATYDRWLAQCEKTRLMFAQEVAAARPSMTVESALATEAQTYMAQDAMALGLIDAVASEEAGFAALLSELRNNP